MKQLIISLLFVIPLFSQQSITFKDYRRNAEGYSFKILKGEITILENVKSIKLGSDFYSMNDVKWVKDENGKVIWSFSDYSKRMKENEKITVFEKECEKNTNTKLLLITLKDDYYGYSDNALTYFDSVCFTIIDPTLALEYFNSNSIEPEDINDYHLKKVAEELGADLVMYGYAYRFEVPYKYSPTTTDQFAVSSFASNKLNSDFSNILTTLTGYIDASKQKSERSQAIEIAGTYINVTLYTIDMKTGKKKYLLQNTTVLKVG
jgi:hypothetical protein